MTLFSFFLLCTGLQLFFFMIFGKKVDKTEMTLDRAISSIITIILTTTITWYCLKTSLPELIDLIKNL
ncbi:MAG: hypothetical protein ACRCYA_13380 [Cetobacterium sp.]|uniref:hypothetical protein n=1 Tax=Cetobacterium sp. TaxID=2071632 RepID=UPI003F39F667